MARYWRMKYHTCVLRSIRRNWNPRLEIVGYWDSSELAKGEEGGVGKEGVAMGWIDK